MPLKTLKVVVPLQSVLVKVTEYIPAALTFMVAVLFGPIIPGPLHSIVLVAELGATKSCVVAFEQLKLPVEDIVGVKILLPAITVKVAIEVLTGQAFIAVDEQV